MATFFDRVEEKDNDDEESSFATDMDIPFLGENFSFQNGSQHHGVFSSLKDLIMSRNTEHAVTMHRLHTFENFLGTHLCGRFLYNIDYPYSFYRTITSRYMVQCDESDTGTGRLQRLWDGHLSDLTAPMFSTCTVNMVKVLHFAFNKPEPGITRCGLAGIMESLCDDDSIKALRHMNALCKHHRVILMKLMDSDLPQVKRDTVIDQLLIGGTGDFGSQLYKCDQVLNDEHDNHEIDVEFMFDMVEEPSTTLIES